VKNFLVLNVFSDSFEIWRMSFNFENICGQIFGQYQNILLFGHGAFPLTFQKPRRRDPSGINKPGWTKFSTLTNLFSNLEHHQNIFFPACHFFSTN
jgi:hypothetical protein